MTETQTKVDKLVGMNYRARVAWDGRGWQGQVDLFSFIAIDFFPRWTCTHSHTTRDEAIACAVRYCKENPAD